MFPERRGFISIGEMEALSKMQEFAKMTISLGMKIRGSQTLKTIHPLKILTGTRLFPSKLVHSSFYPQKSIHLTYIWEVSILISYLSGCWKQWPITLASVS